MLNGRVKPIETIRFEGLSFSHDGHDPILNNVDFEFSTAKALWVKSKEGAGKSTLLQVLAGLLVPQSGAYFINDENVIDMTFEDFLAYRLNIGYTFDYGGLISNRTIQDNLMLPLVYHELIPRPEAKARVDAVVKRFDLGKFRDERPAHVPGRVRKIACLLRALVIHPQMLLLDDPSVGLGVETSRLLVEVIDEMRDQGLIKHILMSTYDEKFMQLFDYDIIQIDQGQLYLQTDDHKKVAHL